MIFDIESKNINDDSLSKKIFNSIFALMETATNKTEDRKNLLKNLLYKPYPFLFTLKRNLIIATIAAIASGFINSIRLDESFALQYLTIPKPNIPYLFGIIVFACIMFIFQGLTSLFTEKTKDNWNIIRELSVVLSLIFTIILFIFTFLLLIAKDASGFLSIVFLLKITAYALSSSIIISIFIVWSNYTIILRNNLKAVRLQNEHLQGKFSTKTHKAEPESISIPTHIKNEDINLCLSNLLFIKSDGNYLEVYTHKDQKTSQKLYRASLQETLMHLEPYPYIIQSHRSYLVNTQNIIRTEGNARNYQLFFKDTELFVPVSRNRFKEFNELLNKNAG